jgi:hypothetical protein
VNVFVCACVCGGDATVMRNIKSVNGYNWNSKLNYYSSIFITKYRRKYLFFVKL